MCGLLTKWALKWIPSRLVCIDGDLDLEFYFFPFPEHFAELLNWRFVAEMLFGCRALRASHAAPFGGLVGVKHLHKFYTSFFTVLMFSDKRYTPRSVSSWHDKGSQFRTSPLFRIVKITQSREGNGKKPGVGGTCARYMFGSSICKTSKVKQMWPVKPQILVSSPRTREQSSRFGKVWLKNVVHGAYIRWGLETKT